MSDTSPVTTSTGHEVVVVMVLAKIWTCRCTSHLGEDLLTTNVSLVHGRHIVEEIKSVPDGTRS